MQGRLRYLRDEGVGNPQSTPPVFPGVGHPLPFFTFWHRWWTSLRNIRTYVRMLAAQNRQK